MAAYEDRLWDRLSEIKIAEKEGRSKYKTTFLIARRIILSIREIEGTIGVPTAEFREDAALEVVDRWCKDEADEDIDMEDLWTMVLEHFANIYDPSPMDWAVAAYRANPTRFNAPGLTEGQRRFATLLACLAENAPDGEAFISCRTAEAVTGVHYRMCARYLRALAARGHVEIIKPGTLADGGTVFRMCHT